MLKNDIISVILANVGAFAVTLATSREWIQIVSLLLAIAFTLYKFYKEWKNG